jgi:hypothetical protein
VSYDDVADQDISSVTKEIDDQLQAWITQASDKKPVAYNADQFTKIKGDLMALKNRLASSPDQPTRDMAARVQSIYDQFEAFRVQVAKDSPVASPQFFVGEEMLLDPQLQVLHTYELSLKSGASTNTASANAASKAPSASQ